MSEVGLKVQIDVDASFSGFKSKTSIQSNPVHSTLYRVHIHTFTMSHTLSSSSYTTANVSETTLVDTSKPVTSSKPSQSPIQTPISITI